MRNTAKTLAAAAAAFMLAGCDIDVPAIAAGDAAVSEVGRIVHTWKLNADQLRDVSIWLSNHKSGWDRNVVTPSAQVSVKLVGTDGTPLGLYISSNQVLINYRGAQVSQTFASAEVVALLTAVGVITPKRTAYVECVCPVNRPYRYQVAFDAPTGEYQYNPHGGSVHESIRTFELWLPGRPQMAAVRYKYSELKLVETTGGDDVAIQLASGDANLDVDGRSLILNLETNTGSFWANGIYPLGPSPFPW